MVATHLSTIRGALEAFTCGTLVASGPCPRGRDGALAIGVTETVSVKSKPGIVVLAEDRPAVSGVTGSCAPWLAS